MWSVAGRKAKAPEEKTPRGKSRQWYAPDLDVDRKQHEAFEHDKAAVKADTGAVLSWSQWVTRQLLRRYDEIQFPKKKR